MKRVLSVNIFFLFIYFVLSGSESDKIKELPLSDRVSELSAVVGNVNAVTGNIVYSDVDIVMPGAETMYFQRFYFPNYYKDHDEKIPKFLRMDWVHNYHSYLIRGREEINKTKYTSYKYVDMMNGGGNYFKNPLVDPSKPHKLWYDPKADSNRWITNSEFGVFSGQIHPKNTKFAKYKGIKQDPKLDHCLIEATTGSGAKKKFLAFSTKKYSHYNILDDINPNGNRIKYEYRVPELTSVTHRNNDETTEFGFFKFHDRGKKGMELETSDGRKVTYTFRKGKKGYFLEHVLRPNAPHVTYEYLVNPPMEDKLRRWHLPDGRYTEFVYYSPDERSKQPRKERQREQWAYLNKLRDYRVRYILQPLDCCSRTPVVAYHFVYDIDVKRVDTKLGFEIASGITHVWNALNFKTSYFYDNDQRLCRIEKYTANQQLYSATNNYWVESGDLKGFLLGKNIQQADGTTLCAHHYSYDENGNLTLDRFLGNLSGSCEKTVHYHSVTPIENGIETYDHGYIYSKDGFNLLLSETEGKVTTRYQYKPGTNLLISKFICENDLIRQREFYSYDKNATLIKTMIDDGCTENPDDHSGISQRLITYITPKAQSPCLGLPEMIEEKYLDLHTMEEKLIRKTQKTYSREGWLLKEIISDSNGEERYFKEWEYNAYGKETRYKDPLGNIVCYGYDENGNCTFEQSSKTCKLFTYDYSNRLVKEELLLGNDRLATSHIYNRLNEPVQSTDIYGNSTTRIFNEFGQEIQTIFPATAAGTAIISRGYDVLGNITVEHDTQGGVIQSTYNVRGQPVTIKYPDGSSETTIYNVDGTVQKKIQRNGTYTEYAYDFLKRPIQENTYDSSGQLLKTTSQTFNSFHLLSKTAPDGQITTFQYDGAGRKISEICGSSEIRYEYDPLGRVSKIIKAYGYHPDEATIEQFTYDLLDRVIEERTEDTSGNIYKKIGYVYDAEGNKTQVTTYNDRGPCITFTEYNPLKQPTRIVDPEGNETTINYHYRHSNSLGQFVLQTTQIDPLGNQTITTYNALNKVEFIERKNPFGITTAKLQNFYDLRGNTLRTVHTVISPKESHDFIIEREYDTSNRIIRVTEAPNTLEQKTTSCIYNQYGQKEITIQPNGIKLYHFYDALGRLSSLKGPELEYQYTYDSRDNVVHVSDPSGTTDRIYDSDNHLIKETLSNGLTIQYQYDRLGRPTQVILPNQTLIDYRYDAAYLRTVAYDKYTHFYETYDLSGQITREKLIGNCGNITHTWDRLHRSLSQQSSYYTEEQTIYDAAGNLRSIRKGDKDHIYTYDDLYQLNSENDHKYTHDSLHNRRSKDEKQYTLNSLNQIISDGTNTYEYNSNGNLIRSGKTEYQYDCLDRLICVATSQSTTRYTYDSFNRRTQKQIYQNGTLIHTYRYMYQGQNETGCFKEQELQELRVLGHGKGAEIGASIGIYLQNTMFAPVHDHTGNIISIANAETGILTERYTYTAFGEEEETNFINPWRFSSKRYDLETGFVYFGRRYYNPALGRWMTPDPKGFAAGPNLYAYVLNSPLTHYDEYGLDWKSAGINYIQDSLKRRSEYLRSMDFLNQTKPIPSWRTSGWSLVNPKRVVENYFKNERSFQTIVVGRGDIQNVRNLFGCGIDNSLEDVRASAQWISDTHGGVNVRGIHLPSAGRINDAFWALKELNGHKTAAVYYEFRRIVEAYEEIKHFEDPVINHHIHSRHGAVFDVVRTMLSDDVKKIMNVYTYGSFKMIPKDVFRECINYVGFCDPVPMGGRILSGFSNLMNWGQYSSEEYNIKVLYGGFSHSFLGNPYRRQTKDIGHEFINKYGYIQP